jgi:hypothetical protein
MPRVPILTSGLALVEAGLIPPPEGLGGKDRSDGALQDWAEAWAVDVDDAEASLAGRYVSAGLTGFLASGDVGRLKPFVGQTVGGFALMTDPDLIEEFDEEHGQIDFQEYYQS